MEDSQHTPNPGGSTSCSSRVLFASILFFLAIYALYWALALKTVIGATADVIEPESGFVLKARVDTGASISSLHCKDIQVEDSAHDPAENSGKRVRFLVEGPNGEEYWLDATILGYTSVRSALGTLSRYRVRMKLTCRGITKEALVSLNDRSDLKYPLLLGRDFLEDDFVVDIGLDNPDFP
jgi:hypothetical protein